MTDHANTNASPLHHPRVRSLGTWLAILGILAVAALALGVHRDRAHEWHPVGSVAACVPAA
jgi:hypothetical protein